MATYCYRSPVLLTFPECELACLKGSIEVLDAQSAGALAAIITRAAVQRPRRDRAPDGLAGSGETGVS